MRGGIEGTDMFRLEKNVIESWRNPDGEIK